MKQTPKPTNFITIPCSEMTRGKIRSLKNQQFSVTGVSSGSHPFWAVPADTRLTRRLENLAYRSTCLSDILIYQTFFETESPLSDRVIEKDEMKIRFFSQSHVTVEHVRSIREEVIYSLFVCGV